MKYSPGSDNPADALSRLPLRNATTTTRNTAEEYIQYVVQNAAHDAIFLRTIRHAMNQDPALQFLCECIVNSNWPKIDTTRPYYGIRHYPSWIPYINASFSLRTNPETCPRRALEHCKDKTTAKRKSLVAWN